MGLLRREVYSLSHILNSHGVSRRRATTVSCCATLIVEHEFADSVREVGALPFALAADSFSTTVGVGFRENGFEWVGRGSELMVCHMRRRDRMTRGVTRCAGGIPGGSVSGVGGFPRCAQRDFAARPGPRLFDCAPGPVIAGSLALKQGQHARRAVSRPRRELSVLQVLGQAAAPYSHEAGSSRPV
jgi:hypothetical protein